MKKMSVYQKQLEPESNQNFSPNFKLTENTELEEQVK